jgi:hypothetical protein
VLQALYALLHVPCDVLHEVRAVSHGDLAGVTAQPLSVPHMPHPTCAIITAQNSNTQQIFNALDNMFFSLISGQIGRGRCPKLCSYQELTAQTLNSSDYT